MTETNAVAGYHQRAIEGDLHERHQTMQTRRLLRCASPPVGSTAACIRGELERQVLTVGTTNRARRHSEWHQKTLTDPLAQLLKTGSSRKRGVSRCTLATALGRDQLLSFKTDLDSAMKKIGFLSFGHWSAAAGSATRSAGDVLLQSIDLAVAAEELGADGAYFRVHHFARQLASPFPLLAAVGARTKRIEIGTGVIDMRYENPLYMFEDACAADLISRERLQLGISRGSPEQVINGWRHFGYVPSEGQSDADMGRRHAEVLLELLKGKGFAEPNPHPMFPNPPGLLRLEPYSPTLRDRIWWGSASNTTAVWAARIGMNLQSSTLKADETGEPFHVQQANQIRKYRDAWREAGHARDSRVSVSRSIFALVDHRDHAYFGRDQSSDQIGVIDNMRAVFGRSYAAEPDVLVEQLKKDEAIAEADTLLLTVPNQLGVDYNAHVIEAILKHVAPAMGWR